MTAEVSFGSDNHSGIHPKVWAALAEANQGHAHAYGGDRWTESARLEFQKQFGPESDVFFVFNGTAANVLALESITARHEAILCTDLAHVNVDEGGAPEAVAGLKLLSVPSENGKLSLKHAELLMVRRGDQHYRQPAALSITQPTEYGTVYSQSEWSQILEFAGRHHLKIHIDGSRLANAAVFRDCTLHELTRGADVISFGGTKNGLLGAEAVVFLKKSEASQRFAYTRKRGMQLGSKMRFASVQFHAYLKDDLWKSIATREHQLAKRLAQGLSKLPNVTVTQPVESNAVFAILPRDTIKPVRSQYFFYIWDEQTWETRLMISFDMSEAIIDDFVARVRESNKADTNDP